MGQGVEGRNKSVRSPTSAVTRAEQSFAGRVSFLDRRFDRLRELGRGACGVVWLVRRKADRKLLAMKTIQLPPLCSRIDQDVVDRRQALREVEILQQLESPYVVRYVDSILAPPASVDQSQCALHIFTEYCNAGDLAGYIERVHRSSKHGIPEADVWRFSAAILHGLCALHARQLLHRDLKPANILLKRVRRPGASSKCQIPTKGKPKLGSMKHSNRRGAISVGGMGFANDVQVVLGDLGLARTVTASQPLASTMVGTPHFLAPEIFEGKPYGEKADVYAYGICIYTLMHGRTPFAHVTNMAALVRHVVELDGVEASEREVVMDQRFSPMLRDLVALCLSQLPAERPTSRELYALIPSAYKFLPCAPIEEAIATEAPVADHTDTSANVDICDSKSAPLGSDRSPPQRPIEFYGFSPPSRLGAAPRPLSINVSPRRSSASSAPPCRNYLSPVAELATASRATTRCLSDSRKHDSLPKDSSGDCGSAFVPKVMCIGDAPSTSTATLELDVKVGARQDSDELITKVDREPSPGSAERNSGDVPAEAAISHECVASQAALVRVPRSPPHCTEYSALLLRGQNAWPGQHRRLKYVQRAHECWSQWRKERHGARRCETSTPLCDVAARDQGSPGTIAVRGRRPATPAGPADSGILKGGKISLEVRGVAPPWTSKGTAAKEYGIVSPKTVRDRNVTHRK